MSFTYIRQLRLVMQHNNTHTTIPALMPIPALPPTRKCSGCQITKYEDCFYANKSNIHGVARECKICQLDTQRKHNNKAKEQDHAAWTLKNKIAKREWRARKKLAQNLAKQAADAPEDDVYDL